MSDDTQPRTWQDEFLDRATDNAEKAVIVTNQAMALLSFAATDRPIVWDIVVNDFFSRLNEAGIVEEITTYIRQFINEKGKLVLPAPPPDEPFDALKAVCRRE